jgi:hypothetical protein
MICKNGFDCARQGVCVICGENVAEKWRSKKEKLRRMKFEGSYRFFLRRTYAIGDFKEIVRLARACIPPE